MRKVPGVEKVAGASDIPPMDYFSPISLAAMPGDEKPMKFDGIMIGEGMTDLLDIEVIEGSSIGTWISTPQLLFNESAAKQFNIKLVIRYRGFMFRVL